MENTQDKLPPFLDQLYCPVHHKRPLEWLCIDRECSQRLFCSFCLIIEHKKDHSDFVSLKSFLSDPFATFNSYLNILEEEEEDEKHLKSIRERIETLIKRNSERIDGICSSIVKEIFKKFNEIKRQYTEELEKFIQNHEKDYQKLEEVRQQFLDFSLSYYSEETMDVSMHLDQLKEGIETLCSKYYSNSDLLNFFQMRVNSLPQILLKEDYKVIVDGHGLANIKWNYFADKCLSTWTFNTKLLPNEFIFSNFDLTAKSKDTNHGTTLLGNEIMDQGYHKWSVFVEEKQAEYLNIGVIPVNPNLNYNMCNYLDAFCISSDNTSYNGSKFNGNFSISRGDVIDLILDFDEDIFVIKTQKFRYEKCNIKGKRLLPYIGFSSFSTTKVSIIK